jgi:hypothetical protein
MGGSQPSKRTSGSEGDRHHVGESLLAGSSPVLYEMGAYDRVRSYGFVNKLGATYVWGRDRKPWGFEFSGGGRLPVPFHGFLAVPPQGGTSRTCRAIVQPGRIAYSRIARFCIASVC